MWCSHTGTLQTVAYIKHHRKVLLCCSQFCKSNGIDNEPIVSKRKPAFTKNDSCVWHRQRSFRRCNFVRRVDHDCWRRKLALFHEHHTMRARSLREQVCLSTQECRNLQHIRNLCRPQHRLLVVHVSEHWQPRVGFNSLQCAQSCLDPSAAVRSRRGAVRLVKRRLEHHRELHLRSGGAHGLSNPHRVLHTFNHIDSHHNK
mmetsp:Transcript_711/g.1838  ORF Transcript_711/g.1838 Transcript_711/m.1838 type:complete len:201 (-) Transcript_711:94-696(-)